jgi:hypothetical protein
VRRESLDRDGVSYKEVRCFWSRRAWSTVHFGLHLVSSFLDQVAATQSMILHHLNSFARVGRCMRWEDSARAKMGRHEFHGGELSSSSSLSEECAVVSSCRLSNFCVPWIPLDRQRCQICLERACAVAPDLARWAQQSIMVCYLQQPRHGMLSSGSITLDPACDNAVLSDGILEILKDDVVVCLNAMAQRG